MTQISVLGAGAFGTALAISMAASGLSVTLWARSESHAQEMARVGQNQKRLPGRSFPESLSVTPDLTAACAPDIILLAIPMQQLAAFCADNAGLIQQKTLVSCCKGVDLKTGLGPFETLQEILPKAHAAVLSGPSFAVDIADGLPTAMTIATVDDTTAAHLQAQLSTDNIRLYSSIDPLGVSLGGALKNVVAIACGLAMGAGLGESARAALITRGFTEMQRLAAQRGADPTTLAGLSGFGDLVLTCTSEKSRNYAHGLRLGRGDAIDSAVTVEGVATARAVAHLSEDLGLDMPITRAVAHVLDGNISTSEAMQALLARPLKRE